MSSTVDDQLRQLASTVLYNLFSSGAVATPINSLTLLARIITTKPKSLASGSARFKLTDLNKFNAILDAFSQSWEHGIISIAKDNNETLIVDVRLGVLPPPPATRKRKRIKDEEADSASNSDVEDSKEVTPPRTRPSTVLGDLSKELREVYAILQKSTAKGRLLAEQLHSYPEAFDPICPEITKEECAKARARQLAVQPSTSSTQPTSTICSRVHFRPLIRPHTDPTLGHCSYLNTCYSEPTYAQSPSVPPSFAMQRPGAPPVSLPSGLGAGGRGKEKAPCRYLHFEIDWEEKDESKAAAWGKRKDMKGKEGGGEAAESRALTKPYKLRIGRGPGGINAPKLEAQWINCDVRKFDYSVLGKFHVIMADPPWDIHMSLPYGTMTDDEMRAMPIPMLQDEGLLFLWVTGRAMEVGRACLAVWGYTRVDEVVWVKTNQLQRVIRTGRTGHWLNHTKEHMLVGLKTNVDPVTGELIIPRWINRGLDTDVIVSEVRETSRKPDEVYGLIERMCPGGRKIEIFGRKHNTRQGWLTLGNQLGEDRIVEEDMRERVYNRYPDRAPSGYFNSGTVDPTMMMHKMNNMPMMGGGMSY